MSDRKLMMSMLQQEMERTKLCLELREQVADLQCQLAEAIEQRERYREALVFATATIFDLKKQIAK